MKITCPECDGTVSKDGEIYVCDKCHARSDCTSPEYHKTHFYCPGCTFQDPHAPMSTEADLRTQLAQRDEMLAKVREECDEARRIGRWVPLWRIIAILDAGGDDGR